MHDAASRGNLFYGFDSRSVPRRAPPDPVGRGDGQLGAEQAVASQVDALLFDRLALLHVEAPGIDRPLAGRRAGILHDQDLADGRGVERALEDDFRLGQLAPRILAVDDLGCRELLD